MELTAALGTAGVVVLGGLEWKTLYAAGLWLMLLPIFWWLCIKPIAWQPAMRRYAGAYGVALLLFIGWYAAKALSS